MGLAIEKLNLAGGLESFAPDLIVVGAGTAGLPLAISGGEAGARVLVLEKTGQIGGTLHRTGGNISAGGTRRQRQRGIEDSPEDHYRDIMRISHEEVEPELTRLACRLAPGMADWLEENGFDFDPATPTITFSHEPYGTPRTFWGVDPGQSILAVFEKLIAPLLAEGKVRILLDTPAEGLLLEDGQGVGVAVAGREFRASSVVITTGGFASNPDLYARFSGGFRPLSSGMPASTGDGIILAEEAEATVAGEGIFLPTVASFADPDHPGQVYRNEGGQTAGPELIPQLRPPWEVWVTTSGERFLREDEPDIEVREDAVKDQGLKFWIVWDEGIQREAPPLMPTWPLEKLRKEVESGRMIQSGGSLFELAGKMDVPPPALEVTIAIYNDAIKSGAADPLGRRHRPRPIGEAPYYAALLHGFANLSWSGLRVNNDLAVLRADGSPIAGLYAVGEVLGFSTFSGRAHCGGMSVGPCISLGRYLGLRLGERAATLRA